jgi:hypothetical protein
MRSVRMNTGYHVHSHRQVRSILAGLYLLSILSGKTSLQAQIPNWNLPWVLSDVQFSGEITLQPIYIYDPGVFSSSPDQEDVKRAQDYYDQELKFARKILGQIGLTVKSQLMWVKPNVPGGPWTYIDRAQFEGLLNTYGPQVTPSFVIPILVVDHWSKTSLDPDMEPYLGQTIPEWQKTAAGLARAGIIIDVPTRWTGPDRDHVGDTLAHEIGHFLLNDATALMTGPGRTMVRQLNSVQPTGDCATIDFNDIMHTTENQVEAMYSRTNYVRHRDPNPWHLVVSMGPFSPPGQRRYTPLAYIMANLGGARQSALLQDVEPQVRQRIEASAWARLRVWPAGGSDTVVEFCLDLIFDPSFTYNPYKAPNTSLSGHHGREYFAIANPHFVPVNNPPGDIKVSMRAGGKWTSVAHQYDKNSATVVMANASIQGAERLRIISRVPYKSIP